MSSCSNCQKDFFCGINSESCWCSKKPLIEITPGVSCLCPGCFDEKLKNSEQKKCFRLWLSYLGESFCGFQVQENGRTVQGELFKALKSITGQDLIITAAGRTDRGVSARGQAVSIEFSTRLSANNLLMALSTKLPKDLAVWRIDPMPLGFDARRQSVGKQYIYRIQQGIVADPFSKHFALHVREELNVELMNQAANFLVGDHDFSSFRASACTAAHAKRYIWQIKVEKVGSLIEIDVRGNAFCLNMVRIIVGTLIEVGKKRRSPESVKVALLAKDRNLAGVTAKPNGLSLEKIYYPDDLSLAAIPNDAIFPRYPVSKESWPF